MGNQNIRFVIHTSSRNEEHEAHFWVSKWDGQGNEREDLKPKH